MQWERWRRVTGVGSALWPVLGFTLLALGHAAVVPVFAAPDEPFHFEYVRHLARHGSLPDQTDPERRISSEGMGPPLYYAVAAAWLHAIDDDLGGGLVVHRHADIERFVAQPGAGMPAHLRPPLNPRYVKWGHGDEPNMFLRMAGDRFPWTGPARVVHWLRLVSVLCGAGTVWLVHRMARVVWPGHPGRAGLAAALVAFDPQMAFLAGSINNDNGVILLSTAALLFTTRLLVRDEPRVRDQWALGASIGAALLCKTNAAFLVPLALGVLAWRAPGADGLRAFVVGATRVGVPAVLITGWWLVRGAMVYGLSDPLGLRLRAAQNPDLVLPAGQRAAFLGEVFGPRLFQSWWGLFDWITLPMPEPLYLFYGLLAGLAVAGAVARFATDAEARERACTVLYAGAFGLSLTALLWLNLTFHSAQARLLFPCVGGVAIVLAGGLETAFSAILPAHRIPVARTVLVIGLALASGWALLGVVAPAYS